MNSHDNQIHTMPVANTKPELHRVLCVDDEPAICFAYSRLFENERFGFDICESIEAARTLLKTNDYFAVISDVRFAGTNNEDGIYFVSVVRKEQPQAKIILVTGYGSEELKNTVQLLGTTHYFEKPIKPSVILELLNSLHLKIHEKERAEFGNLLPEQT